MLVVEGDLPDPEKITGEAKDLIEPPADALRRELREELELDIPVGDLLCVDGCS